VGELRTKARTKEPKKTALLLVKQHRPQTPARAVKLNTSVHAKPTTLQSAKALQRKPCHAISDIGQDSRSLGKLKKSSIKTDLEPQQSYSPKKRPKASINELVRQSLKKEQEHKTKTKQIDVQNSRTVDERRSVLQLHNLHIRQENRKAKQAKVANRYAWGVDQNKFKPTDERAKLEIRARKLHKQQQRARAHSAGKARVGLDVLTEIKGELAAKTRSKSSVGRYAEDNIQTLPREPRKPKAEVISFMKSKAEDEKVRQQRDILEEQVREVKRLTQLAELYNMERQRLRAFKKRQVKGRRKTGETGKRVKEDSEESSLLLAELIETNEDAAEEVRRVLGNFHRKVYAMDPVSEASSVSLGLFEESLASESLARRKDAVKQKVADLRKKVDQTADLFCGPKASSKSSVASLELPIVAAQEFVDKLQEEATVKIQAWVRRFLVRCRLANFISEDNNSPSLLIRETQQSVDTQQSLDQTEGAEARDCREGSEISEEESSVYRRPFLLLDELSSMKEREAELEAVISYQETMLKERQAEELIRKSQIFEELRRLKDREMQIISQVAEKSGSIAEVFSEFISKRYHTLELLVNDSPVQPERTQPRLDSEEQSIAYDKTETMLRDKLLEPSSYIERNEGLVPKALSSSFQLPRRSLSVDESLAEVESWEGSKQTELFIETSERSQANSQLGDYYEASMADSDSDCPTYETSVIELATQRITRPDHEESPAVTAESPLHFAPSESCTRLTADDSEPEVALLPIDFLSETAERVAETLLVSTLHTEVLYLAVEEVAMKKHRLSEENQRLADRFTEEIIAELFDVELDLMPGLDCFIPQLSLHNVKESSSRTNSSREGIDTSSKAVAAYVQGVLCALEAEVLKRVARLLQSPHQEDTEQHFAKVLEDIQNDLPEEPLDFHTVSAPVPLQVYLKLERTHNESPRDSNQTEREAQHIHNKLLFDCMNEALLKAQLPPPSLPWSSSVSRLSKEPPEFGSISSQVVTTVTEWSLTEAGKIPSYDMLLSLGSLDEELLQEQREDRLTNMIYTDLVEQEAQWVDYSFEATQVKLDIADLVLSKLTEEVLQLLSM
jgi:hypothetical protein